MGSKVSHGAGDVQLCKVMSQCVKQSSGVRARKRHRCFFCDEWIEVGERYNRRTGINDGWWIMHMHPECDKATSDWKDWDYETFEQGSLQRGKDEAR